jgi:hypothetical protein
MPQLCNGVLATGAALLVAEKDETGKVHVYFFPFVAQNLQALIDPNRYMSSTIAHDYR